MELKEFEKLKPDVSAIYPAIEIISEHIHAIINVLTDLTNRLDEISKENKS